MNSTSLISTLNLGSKQDAITSAKPLSLQFIRSPVSQFANLQAFLVDLKNQLNNLQQTQVSIFGEVNNLYSTRASTAALAQLQQSVTLVNTIKANTTNPSFEGNITGISKDAVGLSEVNNTSDLDLPISLATQTALDLKASISMLNTAIQNAITTAEEYTDTLNLSTTSTIQALQSTINSQLDTLYWEITNEYNALANTETTARSTQDTNLQSQIITKLATETFQTFSTSVTSSLDSKVPLTQFSTAIDGLEVTLLNKAGLSEFENFQLDTFNSLASKVSSSQFTSSLAELETSLDSKVSTTSFNSSITNLQTDINNRALNTDLTTVSNNLTSLGQTVTTNQSNIILLQAAGVIHDQQITSIVTNGNSVRNRVTALENDSTTLTSTTLPALSTAISSLEVSVTTLNTELLTKHPTIDSSHKLSSSLVDYTSTPLTHVDISSSLQTTLTTLQSDISTLIGINEGDTTYFQQLSADLLGKEDLFSSTHLLNPSYIGTGEVNTTKFNYLKNVSSDLQTQLNDVVTALGNQNNSVIDTLSFADETEQSTAFNTYFINLINAANTKTTYMFTSPNVTTFEEQVVITDLSCPLLDTVVGDVANLQTSKQDVLTSIDPSLISSTGGSLSTQKVAYLSSVSSDIQTLFTNINDALSSHNTAITEQTNVNSALSSTISSLQSSKQDVLTEQSIPQNYVSGLGTTLANKQDSIGNNDLAISYTSGLQSALNTLQTNIDTKWTTPMNATALGYVDIGSSLNGLLSEKQGTISNISYFDPTSSIQTQLDGKWNTPINASSLEYVDIGASLNGILSQKQSKISNIGYFDATSSIQTQLDSKWNTPSNTTALGHVDITSSLTTLLGQKQNTISNIQYFDATSSIQTQLDGKQPTITDNSLTIARTTNLQTSLDEKASKNGATYTGTHDFTGATVTGVGSGTIADGSLTIAKTANLQTSLDGKASKSGATYTGTHDFTAATVTGVSTTITDGALTIAKTANLQTTLDAKFNNIGTVVIQSGSGTVNLTASDMNKFHIIYTASTKTIVMPDGATVSDGAKIFFNFNPYGGASVTVNVYYYGTTTQIANGAFTTQVATLQCGSGVNLYWSAAISKWIRF